MNDELDLLLEHETEALPDTRSAVSAGSMSSLGTFSSIYGSCISSAVSVGTLGIG